jgi:hypothetical protein
MPWQKPGYYSRPVLLGFMVDKAALGQLLPASHDSIMPLMLHTHSSITSAKQSLATDSIII